MSTVLVIEDDPDMREIERATLGSAGHEVKVAANGREGLAVLERVRPCVILLDLMMPVMDGWYFLDMIKNHPEYKTLKVLVLTAAHESQTRTVQADGVVRKPFDLEALVGRVRELLTA